MAQGGCPGFAASPSLSLDGADKILSDTVATGSVGIFTEVLVFRSYLLKFIESTCLQ
jgi:hypothetical protein